MRWTAVLVLVLVLVGCGFTVPAGSPDLAIDATVETDAPAIDAAEDATADAAVAPFCDPAEPALVACYPFEGSVADGSANHLATTSSNVTFPTGKVGQAAQLGSISAIEIADSALFDSAGVTVEAWIKPSQIPTAGLRAGVADMNGQWGLFVHEMGRLQCTVIGGTSMQIDAQIPTGVWTHVACTYGAGTTTIYVNGVNRFQAGGGGALATAGNTGVSIGGDNPAGSGSRLTGMIDQLRVLSRARTPEEICVDAQACPPFTE